jgi:hypothetical protein
LDEGVGMDVITIDFSKVFDSVPHDQLLTKLAVLGVDLRVWVREFLVGLTQRVRVGGQISREVKVASFVPHGGVLGSLLFLVYTNNIWRNIDSCIRLFADDCVIFRKITNKNDIEKLQKELDSLGEWLVENWMKLNPGKSKAIRFTRSWAKNTLGYFLGNQKIPEASSCKLLGIILQSNLSWVDQADYIAQKAWEALHFVMCVFKKRSRNTKSLDYTSLVRPVLECGSAC